MRRFGCKPTPADKWEREEAEARDAYPVCEDQIVEYVANEYVYAEAGRWSNARIRAYLDRST